MTDRIRIDIPDAKLPPAAHEAAGIGIAFCRSCGADPWKIVDNPMGRQIFQAWVRGEYTDAEVRHMVGNLLILNPALKLAEER